MVDQRELEEYRPCRGGLPQFQKEIGKYVTAAEVARFEQYVFVPVDLNTAPTPTFCRFPALVSGCCACSRNTGLPIDRAVPEIGKYVNAKEVARLERQVTLQ